MLQFLVKFAASASLSPSVRRPAPPVLPSPLANTRPFINLRTLSLPSARTHKTKSLVSITCTLFTFLFTSRAPKNPHILFVVKLLRTLAKTIGGVPVASHFGTSPCPLRVLCAPLGSLCLPSAGRFSLSLLFLLLPFTARRSWPSGSLCYSSLSTKVSHT